MGYSAYSVKSTPPRVFSLSDILKMCMMISFEEEKSLLGMLTNYNSKKKFDAVKILCN